MMRLRGSFLDVSEELLPSAVSGGTLGILLTDDCCLWSRWAGESRNEGWCRGEGDFRDFKSIASVSSLENCCCETVDDLSGLFDGSEQFS